MADEIVIDLSNYKDRFGSNVPANRYRVQIEDAEVGESNAHNPMIILWYRIMGGPFDGSVIVDRLAQTDNAMWRTVSLMQAIGLPTPKKQLRARPSTWVGKVLDIDVEDGDPFNGKVKSEVRGHMRVERATGAASSPEDELADLGEFAPGTTSNPSNDTMARDGDVVDLDAVDL
jgi:hypothetical protein